jgi:hypothetical protein
VVPEQQRALKRMRTLRAKGVALRAIADEMTAAGVQISHMGVKKALAAADQRARLNGRLQFGQSILWLAGAGCRPP